MSERKSLQKLDDIMDITYLDTAATGLIESDVLQVGEQFNRDIAQVGSVRAEQWLDRDVNEIRKTVADFLHCPDDTIFFGPNYSFLHQEVLRSMLDVDRLLLYEEDYPSLVDPIKASGKQVFFIGDDKGFSLPIDRIEKSIIENDIQAVAISHVQWLSGFKINLKELGEVCRSHDVLLLVDGTQSLGAVHLRLDELPIDVFIASNYKWMNAGFGTATTYLSKNFQERFQPRMETGHLNMAGLLMLAASVKHKLQRGFAKMEAHHQALVEMLLRELSVQGYKVLGDITAKHRAGIVVFDGGEQVLEHCLHHNVIVSLRGGRIRVSPHTYNSESDIVKLLETLNSA